MSDLLPASLLSEFSEVLAARTGLYFPLERWRELERGLGRVAAEMKCANTESCLRRLLNAPLAQNEIEMLARHLTVGETYFFRDQRQFDALEEHVLAELIASPTIRPVPAAVIAAGAAVTTVMSERKNRWSGRLL